MLLEGQYLVMDVYEPETLGCIRDVFGRIFMGCSWFYAAGETWIHPYLSRGKKDARSPMQGATWIVPMLFR